MQQSSATQSLHLCFWGLRKIVACSHSSSQCLLVPTVFGMVSSLHPTSFLYSYNVQQWWVLPQLATKREEFRNQSKTTHGVMEH